MHPGEVLDAPHRNHGVTAAIDEQQPPVRRVERSFCRICPGFCGVLVHVESDRIVAVQGDKRHAMTGGYICSKGVHAARLHHGAPRLLSPLRRTASGGFEPIGIEQVLDEIAERLRAIRDRDGADAIAMYRGTANGLNGTATPASLAFLQAIGSASNYSSMTVDQSAKWVAAGRLGAWEAGRQHMDHSDVMLLFGTNPLVSLLGGLNNVAPMNPLKRFKDAKARGMKLIVVDPRRTETARDADVFLQPLPGEDPTLAAGMLRMVLAEGWQDQAFCDRHATGVEALRAAVEPFTVEYVAQRARVPAATLREATALFARDSRRGAAASGTGPNMAPRSNLAEHLIECLNVICGRYARAGDPIANPGAMSPPMPVRAQVIAPSRSWEHGPRSRIRDTGTLYGERMSGLLADEILMPGPGQVRALLSAGGNPASALPDQDKVVRALASLELLVAVEPFMSTTARLAHYILPTKLLYERADIPPTGFYERSLYDRPFAQYSAELLRVPAGSEVVDDWYVYWSLARRLGVGLTINQEPLDMTAVPRTDDLIAIILRGARVTLDEMRASPGGILRSDIVEQVQAAAPEATARFDVMPDDVADEMAEIAAQPPMWAGEYTHRLTVRRVREVINTTGHALVADRHPYNAAYLNPEDMRRWGLCDGDEVEISAAHATIRAIVTADPSVRDGVISMSHGWGGLPQDSCDPRKGVCTNRLVSTEHMVEAINAMPALSAIPVMLRPFRP